MQREGEERCLQGLSEIWQLKVSAYLWELLYFYYVLWISLEFNLVLHTLNNAKKDQNLNMSLYWWKKTNRIRNTKETLRCFIYLFKYCVLWMLFFTMHFRIFFYVMGCVAATLATRSHLSLFLLQVVFITFKKFRTCVTYTLCSKV